MKVVREYRGVLLVVRWTAYWFVRESWGVGLNGMLEHEEKPESSRLLYIYLLGCWI